MYVAPSFIAHWALVVAVCVFSVVFLITAVFRKDGVPSLYNLGIAMWSVFLLTLIDQRQLAPWWAEDLTAVLGLVFMATGYIAKNLKTPRAMAEERAD